MKKKGFTLVELMIAVSILAIGIVMVLRSFLNSALALDSIQNRIIAIRLFENKMAQLEQAAVETGGVQQRQEEEEVMLGARSAVLKLEIAPLESQTPDAKEERINEVRMNLSWKESNRAKEEDFACYLPKKE